MAVPERVYHYISLSFVSGVPGVVKLEVWLTQHLPKGSRVAVDPQLVSVGDWRTWSRELYNGDHTLVPVTTNLVDILWDDRPPPPNAIVLAHPLKYSGMFFNL